MAASVCVLLSAIVLLLDEGAVFLYWAATGIYVAAVTTGSEHLLKHVVGSLHFLIPVVMCQVFEEHGKLVRIRGAQKKMHKQFSETDVPQPVYLLSWALPVLVTVFTDAYMLVATGHDFKEAGGGGTVITLELVYCIWAMASAAVAIIWSAWVFALSRGLRRKVLIFEKVN